MFYINNMNKSYLPARIDKRRRTAASEVPMLLLSFNSKPLEISLSIVDKFNTLLTLQYTDTNNW